MDKQPTTDDWPVKRGWTLYCSRCREEGQTYEDTEGPEHAISLFEERGWTLEWDEMWRWRAYCPECTRWRKVM